MSMRRNTHLLIALAIVGTGVGVAYRTFGTAQAANAVAAEGVSNYSLYNTRHTSQAVNIDGAQEASGFLTTISPNTGPWTPGMFWTDTNVWDSDFFDPDITGMSGDDDQLQFDNPNANGLGEAALAFVMAHGANAGAMDTTPCTTSAQCGTGEYCTNNPPTAYQSSRCDFGGSRRLLVSGTTDTHSDTIIYSSGGMKLGEDAFSGGWAGAGTNGAVGVAFILNSFGTQYPFFWGQSQPVFAGAMQVNFTMPNSNVGNSGQASVTADFVTWSIRGTVLANYALANPNGVIQASWAANMNSAGHTGRSCPDLTGTYTYGGGGGFDGCAGYLTVAWDSTQAKATAHVNSLTWAQAHDFSNKATGNAFGYAWIQCNYDCVTYPFTK